MINLSQWNIKIMISWSESLKLVWAVSPGMCGGRVLWLLPATGAQPQPWLQTSNNTNNFTFWHTQKNTCQFNVTPQKKQDFSTTKYINNAEHIEMALNC